MRPPTLLPTSRLRLALACALAAGGCGTSDGHPDGHDDHGDGGEVHFDYPDLARGAGDPTPTGPNLLSETGLYEDAGAKKVVARAVEVTPKFPLYADGAELRRFLLLPENTKIDNADPDIWRFPVGTKVWQEFRVGGKLVETRFQHKQFENRDGWWRASYVWRAGGDDAEAQIEGAADIGGTTHNAASQEECAKCHGNTPDSIIGVSAIQLGADGSGELKKLADAGLLTVAPPAEGYTVPGNAVEKAALAYMHGNCGHCHSAEAYLASKVALRLRLRVADATPAATGAYTTTIGQKALHKMPTPAGDIQVIVVAGQPEQSQLYVRMGKRDDWSMPDVGTEVPDPIGQSAVRRWIEALPK